jgi:hypothetical protein
MRNHELYLVWNSIIQRTTNENYKGFHNYGSIGIEVCDEWLDINNFIKDMYPSYQKGLSIDRIDNNEGYYKSNCRWTTRTVQSRNTRLLKNTNTSGYRGVDFYKAGNKWRARVRIDNGRINLGYFNTALEAAIAYDNYVINNNLEHTINGVEKCNMVQK